ncbi:altronate dehydratase large subunit [Caldalkalibacillus uzonensis]|uniref:Altronate dehydratase large subunit n=1 Tax=Caldalkalibacillus uzonensis TaxID=353224 RepID=A0ABU0CNG2_9BACI|nr:UxaA family hydrolase [Caldalkalibacillus uzonensis]MDQ0337955.1 altronate dehydratase large subunit [Caldalkalibacillus uzonensis]
MDQFFGYVRPDGSAGIRNYLLILSGTVYANSTAERVANTIEGAIAITHPLGRCQVKPDLRTTFKTLVGMGKNPNVGGVVVIDHFREEGCTAEEIAHEISQTGKPVEVVNIRHAGGAIAATAEATRKAMLIKRQISRLRREPVPISNLLFGLNCGTSDTTSGLGSNPSLGFCSDKIIAQGGRSILAEVTELMGAEDYIRERAVTPEVGERIVAAIQHFERRALESGEDIRGSQPTGDNIVGGLSSIEEKSLGAYQKSGSATIMDLIDYAEAPAKDPGLYVMYTPGHGSESITGIAAAGAQVLVFSTGGGHVINHPIMPTIRITSNVNSYQAMQDTLELDLSDIFNGDLSLEAAGDLIYDEVLETCNGKLTKSEILKEYTGFAIHRTGVSI